nr:FtsJ-like methyltransferase [Oceanusvirus sp.]
MSAISRRAEVTCDSCELRRALCFLKNRIGRYSSDWDAYKVLHNPYESVYTVSPCVSAGHSQSDRKHPVSRAFYKMWELCGDSADLTAMLSDPAPKRFAYVAEGPGSFVEAVVTLRDRACGEARRSDTHTAVTLASSNRTVPTWKIQQAWARRNRVTLSTGDVCSSVALRSFVTSAGGECSCDLVTGDGGFDFSSDFNEQERQMIRLISSECSVAARLLKPGGAAVIKVFDAFDPRTVAVMGRFASMFDSVDLVKPKTSRPANSERYMVCTGFARSASALRDLESAAAGRHLAPQGTDQERHVSEVSKSHAVKQTAHILQVMDAIDRQDKTPCEDLVGEWLREYGLEEGEGGFFITPRGR